MPAPNDSFLAALASRASGKPMVREQPQGYVDLVQGAESGGQDFLQQALGLKSLIDQQAGVGAGVGMGGGIGPIDGNLRTINGVTMIAPAMRSLMEARRELGLPIFGNVVSSYRTRAQQQDLWNRYQAGTGNLAARPGTSNHETGHAVDISSSFLSSHPELRSWLFQHGWTNDVPGEPWHWQYGV